MYSKKKNCPQKLKNCVSFKHKIYGKSLNALIMSCALSVYSVSTPITKT